MNYKTSNHAEMNNISNVFFQFLKKAEKDLKLMSGEMSTIVAARNNFMEQLSN